MTHKFYFQRENAALDASTVVYVVKVGESLRQVSLFAKAQNYAREHGCTFRKWTEDIDFFLDYESERVFSGSNLVNFGFVRACIDLSELVKLMDEGNWLSFENSLSEPKAKIHQISTFYPIVKSLKSSKSSRIVRPALQRNDLSELQPLLSFC